MENEWQTTVPTAPDQVDVTMEDDPELSAEIADDSGERRDKWQRIGAFCGIAAVAAMLASAFIVAQPPKANAPAAKILTYYVEHRRALLFSQWLGGLGAALFLWFVGSLWGTWARSDDSGTELSAITLGGGIALAAGSLVATGMNLTLVYLARQIQNSPDLVRTLYAAQLLTFTILFFAAAVFLAAGGMLVRRLGSRVLGLLGIGLAVYELFAAGAISDFGGVRSPTGPLTLVAFFGLLAWVLLASIAMLRGLGHRSEDDLERH